MGEATGLRAKIPFPSNTGKLTTTVTEVNSWTAEPREVERGSKFRCPGCGRHLRSDLEWEASELVLVHAGKPSMFLSFRSRPAVGPCGRAVVAVLGLPPGKECPER